MKAIEHLKTINAHRRLVRKGCFRVGLYYQGLTHDLSKYSPVEFWRSRGGDFDFVILTKDKGVVYSTPLKDSISLRFDFDSVRVVE